MSMILSVRTLVLDVRERKERSYVSGYGDKTVFKNFSHGWELVLSGGEGSGSFSINVGKEMPKVTKGAFVRIDVSVTP